MKVLVIAFDYFIWKTPIILSEHLNETSFVPANYITSLLTYRNYKQLSKVVISTFYLQKNSFLKSLQLHPRILYVSLKLTAARLV